MYILTENIAEGTPQSSVDLTEKVNTALDELTERLYQRYALQFPHRILQVRQIIVNARTEASLTAYPHLFFPDLVQIRMAQLLLSSEKVNLPGCYSLAQAA